MGGTMQRIPRKRKKMSHSCDRRNFLQWSTCLAASSALSIPSIPRAQQRPETTRILCGYPAGGSVDVVSRKLAERLGRGYGRATLVETRTGAAGRLVFETLKTASSDGSVMLVTPGSAVTMYPHIYRPLPYDVFNDLTPVAMLASTEFCLAIGPAVSCVCEMGMIPERLNKPTVGFKPTTPLVEAGHVTEPSVSVPTDTAHKLAAVAAPEPELEPQGLRSSA